MSPEGARTAVILFIILAAAFALLTWRLMARRRRARAGTADLQWPITPPAATDADIAELTDALHAAERDHATAAAAAIAERLASLTIARGAPEDALDILRPYRLPLEKGRHWVALARLLLVGGAAQAALGRHYDAQSELRRAAALFERARADRGAATARHALGDLLHRAGDIPGAAAEYALAAGRHRRLGNVEAADRLFAATRALEELTAADYSETGAAGGRRDGGGASG